MSCFLVASYNITNEEGYAPYPGAVAPTLIPFGGELIVADFDSEAVEGNPRKVTIIVSFPDRDAARAWYKSPAYQEVLPLRLDNTEGDTVFVDEWIAP